VTRPSQDLLEWLRSRITERGLNTAAVAESAGLPRSRVRRILSGAEPMLVDELLQLSQVLELSPSDFGLTEPEAEEVGPAPVRVASRHEEAPVTADPWGNHPEQIFRFAFRLGCDFLFLASVEELDGSGVPAEVLSRYEGGEVPIKLDAAYHQYNAPRYESTGVTLTLSFDALYDCRFPWTSIRQVILTPVVPEADEPEEPEQQGPMLRLV